MFMCLNYLFLLEYYLVRQCTTPCLILWGRKAMQLLKIYFFDQVIRSWWSRGYKILARWAQETTAARRKQNQAILSHKQKFVQTLSKQRFLSPHALLTTWQIDVICFNALKNRELLQTLNLRIKTSKLTTSLVLISKSKNSKLVNCLYDKEIPI